MKYKIIIVAILILLGNQKNFSQNSLVKGKIIDYETNRPMPGATVVENFPSNGTISGKDGNFEMHIKSNTKQLEFNFIGYYPIKFINIPVEKKHIDLGEIKLVQNYLMSNIIVGGPPTKIDEVDKQKDEKFRNNVLKKYRLKVLGKKLKPYFEGKYLVFDFNKNGNK
jgi:hypothetical protein